MSDTCDNHRHAMSILTNQLIPWSFNWAPGWITAWIPALSTISTQPKWKESIACHHSTSEIETEMPGFGNGLLQCIDQSLAGTTGKQLLVFCRTIVLDLVCFTSLFANSKISYFYGRKALGYFFMSPGPSIFQVPVLFNDTVQQGSVLFIWKNDLLLSQKNAVFLFQHFKASGVKEGAINTSKKGDSLLPQRCHQLSC